MALALFADGSRREIRANRDRGRRVWSVGDGPFTREELDEIRFDVEVARDADAVGRHDLADELRSRARRNRESFKQANMGAFRPGMPEMFHEERVLRWRERVTPEWCYGPLESDDWRWEQFGRFDPEGPFWARVEWILIEDGCPRYAQSSSS